MKIEVFRQKNMYGEHTAQMDFGETQISVITKTKKEVNRIVKELRKIIKP